jgi:uridine kinase
MRRIVGVGGGSGSGKSTLAAAIVEALGPAGGVVLPFDAYYRERTEDELANPDALDFDAPHALDAALLADHLDAWRAGEAVAVPRYDFASHRRVGQVPLPSTRVLVVEGLHTLGVADVRGRLDLGVFVEAPASLRLDRRIGRDVRERGRDEAEVRQRVASFVEPAYVRWIEPSRHHAHVVVDGTTDVREAVGRVLAALTR